ncbi:negative regulator of sigma E activity [Paenibacillus mucilaginosus]|uniref:sigma-E factor regulatory protein RseB domain-containing protein n=1 Tax=Paenibacillus mucilaginosus TaxID=61624 RepID=UPI003D221245
MGRETTILEGKLGTNMVMKRKARTYKFWVDPKTGMLLKLWVMNDEGTVVMSIETLSLSFDEALNSNQYQVSRLPSDWKLIKDERISKQLFKLTVADLARRTV